MLNRIAPASLRLGAFGLLAGAVAISFSSGGCSSSTGGSPGNLGSTSGGSTSSSGATSGDDASGGSSSGNTTSSSSGSGTTSGGGTSSGGTGSSGGSSGGHPSSGGSSGSSGGSSSGTEGGVTGSYPAGPYCTAAGTNGSLTTPCVLPNMTWIGYVNDTGSAPSSTLPYVTYSLDQARKSGKRWAMINVAEYDCPGCQNSAKELGASGAAVIQAGGIVIELLESKLFSTTTVPAMTDLQYWAGGTGTGNNTWTLSVTALKDPDSSTGNPSFNFFGHRDQAYIVDLSTMTATMEINGSFVAVTTNSAGLAMNEMHTLLGK